MLLFVLHVATALFFGLVLLGGALEARAHKLPLGRTIGLMLVFALFVAQAAAATLYLVR
jgi:hypothetical protein